MIKETSSYYRLKVWIYRQQTNNSMKKSIHIRKEEPGRTKKPVRIQHTKIISINNIGAPLPIMICFCGAWFNELSVKFNDLA